MSDEFFTEWMMPSTEHHTHTTRPDRNRSPESAWDGYIMARFAADPWSNTATNWTDVIGMPLVTRLRKLLIEFNDDYPASPLGTAMLDAARVISGEFSLNDSYSNLSQAFQNAHSDLKNQGAMRFWSRIFADVVFDKRACIDIADALRAEFQRTGQPNLKKLAIHYMEESPAACGDVEFMLRSALLNRNWADLHAAKAEAETQEKTLDPAYQEVVDCLASWSEPGPSHIVFHNIAASVNREEKTLLARYEALQGLPLSCVPSPDPVAIQKTLDIEFPWLSDTSARLRLRLEVALSGRKGFYLPPMLLCGPPGTGKTRYVRRLAELVTAPLQIIAVGGSSDNRALAGTARGWGTARPGQIVDLIASTRVPNPIILLDELDKEAESNRNGRITDTLHQLLESENSARWVDECLLGTCDLSRVVWVATANRVDHLPSSLLSRFDVVQTPKPAKDAIFAIIHGIRRDFATRYGLEHYEVPAFTNGEWDYLVKTCSTPRHAVRVTETLLGLKFRELRQQAH